MKRVAFLALAAFGCTEPSVPGAAPHAFVIRDSAGVRIVENFEPAWEPGMGWSIDPSPTLTIGEQSGDDAYLFTWLSDAMRLPSGEVAVVEGRTVEIRIFDGTGQFLRSIGRRGDGPGEFQDPPVVALAPPDTLITWDSAALRLSRFSADGELLAESPVRLDTQPDGWVPVGGSHNWRLASTGDLVAWASVGSTGSLFASGTAPVVSDWKSDHRLLPANGSGVVPLGVFGNGEMALTSEGRASNPFAVYGQLALSPSGGTVSVAPQDRWEVRTITLTGATMLIGRIDRPRQVVDRALIQRFRNHLAEAAEERGDPPDGVLNAWDALTMPDSTRATSDLHLDGLGNRFLRRWTAPWDLSDPVWEVLDGDGRWLGPLTIPDSLGTLLRIDGDEAHFEWRDALDVPFLRVHRLRKGNG